jgi:hypoxanthine phosphoribosyltransferase
MKYFYTWEEFNRDADQIAEWAKDRNFRAIYGIPRGGLVLAVLLSHRLNLPLVMSMEEISSETLVVDDISDSGATLARFYGKLNFRPAVATIFYHKNTRQIPDFALHEKREWVVFPWETEASSRYDATLK